MPRQGGFSDAALPSHREDVDCGPLEVHERRDGPFTCGVLDQPAMTPIDLLLPVGEHLVGGERSLRPIAEELIDAHRNSRPHGTARLQRRPKRAPCQGRREPSACGLWAGLVCWSTPGRERHPWPSETRLSPSTLASATYTTSPTPTRPPSGPSPAPQPLDHLRGVRGDNFQVVSSEGGERPSVITGMMKNQGLIGRLYRLWVIDLLCGRNAAPVDEGSMARPPLGSVHL